jgi:hypothetical protein
MSPELAKFIGEESGRTHEAGGAGDVPLLDSPAALEEWPASSKGRTTITDTLKSLWQGCDGSRWTALTSRQASGYGPATQMGLSGTRPAAALAELLEDYRRAAPPA